MNEWQITQMLTRIFINLNLSGCGQEIILLSRVVMKFIIRDTAGADNQTPQPCEQNL